MFEKFVSKARLSKFEIQKLIKIRFLRKLSDNYRKIKISNVAYRYIILVHKSTVVKNFKNLIEYLKSSASKLQYGDEFMKKLNCLGLNMGFDKF